MFASRCARFACRNIETNRLPIVGAPVRNPFLNTKRSHSESGGSLSVMARRVSSSSTRTKATKSGSCGSAGRMDIGTVSTRNTRALATSNAAVTGGRRCGPGSSPIGINTVDLPPQRSSRSSRECSLRSATRPSYAGSSVPVRGSRQSGTRRAHRSAGGLACSDRLGERMAPTREGSIMLAYGWTFLAIAIVLGALAFTGYAGTYAFGAKVVAAGLLLISLAAFAAEKRAPAS